MRFDGKHFVIVAASEEVEILELTTVAEDVLELTDVVGTSKKGDILELTTEVSEPGHGALTREEIIAAMRRLVSGD